MTAVQFAQLLAEHNAVAAKNVAPDCISIVSEPNTDWGWTGQSLYKDPTQLSELVQYVTNAIINSAGNQIEISAGCDSWMSKAQDYDNALYKVNGLTDIDIHTYFAGGGDLERMTALAQGAQNAGKGVVVSECWLTKTGNGFPPAEPSGEGEAARAQATNSFSFWQPLDEKYMSAFVKWAQVYNPRYFCFFYPQQLFASLDYDTVHCWGVDQIVDAEMAAEISAIKNGQFSPVGLYYAKLLAGQ